MKIPVRQANGASVPKSVKDLTDALRAVAEIVKPAVVQINNLQNCLDKGNRPGRFLYGSGSGVIIDPRGYILTNYHVIRYAGYLQISLTDGRILPGKLIGCDSTTDLAIVRIDASDLPEVQLGDSDQLQIGDWVVAIGWVPGANGSPIASGGVIRGMGAIIAEPGLDRMALGRYLFDMLQTDAAIHPGCSGGALVNLAGQVIGINTGFVGNSGKWLQSKLIGYAISMASAKPIASQIIRTGRAVHPYLGIDYVRLTPALAAVLGIKQNLGVILSNVIPGSPAEKSGLQQFDVIIAVDNQPLLDDSDLAKIITSHKPGDATIMTFYRGDHKIDQKLTLADKPYP